MRSGKLTLALLGAWHVHTRMYLPQINELFGDKIEWAYVCDSDKSRAEEYSKLLGCPIADMDTVLSDDTVDAVIIEAETYKHRDMIVGAAKAGKHVYTEKIMCMNAAEAMDIKRAVEAAGIRFVVSHESLPVSAYAYIKKQLDDGQLGDLVSIYFRRAHGMARMGRLDDQWFKRSIAGGGALIDLGIHGVSMLAHFGKEPVEVSAYTSNYTGHETEDSATIMVKFAGGAIGTAHTDMMSLGMHNNLEVIGTKAQYLAIGNERCANVFKLTDAQGFGEPFEPVPESEYASRTLFPVTHFVGSLLDENWEIPSGLDLETAIKVVKIVDAAYRSAETGKSVKID